MLLSIITINYNNLEGLKKTFASVVNQTFKDYEWIVIDGGSSDGSKEFIEQHMEKFAYWCSEPDKGVYNAMNKGIDKAMGVYLNFMNSGDCYHEKETLEKVFSSATSSDIIYGDVLYVHRDYVVHEEACHPLTLRHLNSSTIFHQSSFIKLRLFDDSGYDEDLKIVSDWKKWVEWLLQNRIFEYRDLIVADMDYGGISHNNVELRNMERDQVLEQIMPKGISCLFDEVENYEREKAYNPDFVELYNLYRKRRFYKRLISLGLYFIRQLDNILDKYFVIQKLR